MRVSYLQGDVDISNLSDEAYALAALKNFYDFWMEIADKLIMADESPRKTAVKKVEAHCPACESDVPTKCTSFPVKQRFCRRIGSEQKEATSKMILA